MPSGSLTKSNQVSFADAVEANRAFSSVVKGHLRSTYAHFAGGLAMTRAFAYAFHRNGWGARLMTSKNLIRNTRSIGSMSYFSSE